MQRLEDVYEQKSHDGAAGSQRDASPNRVDNRGWRKNHYNNLRPNEPTKCLRQSFADEKKRDCHFSRVHEDEQVRTRRVCYRGENSLETSSRRSSSTDEGKGPGHEYLRQENQDEDQRNY